MNLVKLIGWDVGGTKCAVLLGEGDPQSGEIRILDKKRFPTPALFDEAYALFNKYAEEILRSNALSYRDITAIGVSCGGPLDPDRGTVLCPPNLPDWKNIPLTDMLRERYGVPAYLQNDANACALVEWRMGAGRGSHNMIFLTMGTGMGSGIILNDRLVNGACGMGGEVGHIRLAEDGPYGYGKTGSFEGFCSGGGMQRQAEAFTKALTGQGINVPWAGEKIIDTRVMAEYARMGDSNALKWFDGIGQKLGRGLSVLVDILNPEVIVIGSIFVRCEDLLRPAMEREMKKECIPYSLETLRVLPAQTGESIGDLAALMTGLEEIDGGY